MLRIYVACLESYNNGRLVGRWFDLDDYLYDVDALHADINNTIRGEEYAIHDYEGFGPMRIGEFNSIAYVLAIAESADIADHVAMLHWLALDVPSTADDVRERAESFGDAYRGHWSSWTEYAEQFADDVYADAIIAAEGIPYVTFDYSALAIDLEMELSGSEGDGGIYLFESAY